MEDDLTGRQPQMKRTSQEYDLEGRKTQKKTTSGEEDFTARQPHRINNNSLRSISIYSTAFACAAFAIESTRQERGGILASE